jgi:hypothetical protein
MKLYRIDISYEILVAAEDEDAAIQVAIDKAEEALRDMPDQPDMAVSEITTPAEIPDAWRGCYLYREDRYADATVEAVLRGEG